MSDQTRFTPFTADDLEQTFELVLAERLEDEPQADPDKLLEDTPDREVFDRFGDFLQARAAVTRRIEDGTYRPGQLLPPHVRYRLRFLAWRLNQPLPTPT